MKYPTKRIKANEVLDEIESMSAEGVKLFHRHVSSNECQVYLDEMIGPPSFYRNLIHYMHNMQEDDSLTVWMDTGGGHIDGAMALIDAMQTTEGCVQVIVTGMAGSAGSIIALNAPNLVIGNRARFFLHAASYGVGHMKQGEVESTVENNKIMLRSIYEEAYSGFLTEQEIEMLFIGKDYYFDTTEVNRRVEQRQKLKAEKYSEMVDDVLDYEEPRVISDEEREAVIQEAVESVKPVKWKKK